MKKNKMTVSIDFDGVLIEKILGVDWKSQGKSRVMKDTLWFKIYRLVDMTWAMMNHVWRKPVPGSLSGLQKMKGKGYKLVLVTSRQGYLREITFGWLKRWGYYQFFDDFYFNDKLIGGVQSKVDNIKLAGSEIHIDDNRETVERLAQIYPDMVVYYLCQQSGRPDALNIVKVGKWAEIQI
jgi:uncharacterized HAD superfamily protein